MRGYPRSPWPRSSTRKSRMLGRSFSAKVLLVQQKRNRREASIHISSLLEFCWRGSQLSNAGLFLYLEMKSCGKWMYVLYRVICSLPHWKKANKPIRGYSDLAPVGSLDFFISLLNRGGYLLRAVRRLTLRWKLQILSYFYSFQSFQSIFRLCMMKQ